MLFSKLIVLAFSLLVYYSAIVSGELYQQTVQTVKATLYLHEKTAAKDRCIRRCRNNRNVLYVCGSDGLTYSKPCYVKWLWAVPLQEKMKGLQGRTVGIWTKV